MVKIYLRTFAIANDNLLIWKNFGNVPASRTMVSNFSSDLDPVGLIKI